MTPDTRAHILVALLLLTPEEDRAIGAAREAWDAAGRPHTECDALARARVAVLWDAIHPDAMRRLGAMESE